jgi:preprotein translocase subunit SecA
VIRVEWQKRHDQVLAAGGLHVIGTERHESRRIDNQLRGRSGRQGDPGSSRFYLSLEDNLLRIFGSDRLSGWMQRLGMQPGEAIEHPWVTRAIENAQRKVEGRNFDIRKQLLEYDDVANDQRKVIYEQRNRLMEVDDISESIIAIRADVVNTIVSLFIPPESIAEQWDVKGLEGHLEREYGLALPVGNWLDTDTNMDEAVLRSRLIEEFEKVHTAKVDKVGTETMRHFEKAVMLQVLDAQWKDHLAAMDHLRQGIHLRGYAQKNPKEEYKREAFQLFSEMLDRIKQEVIGVITRVQIREEQDVEALEAQRQAPSNVRYEHPSTSGEVEDSAETQTVVRAGPKVGRNSPCPCGSGKKFKQCHGKL